MKLSVSNIAMPSFNHGDILKALAQQGIGGLEVAPSKVWKNTSQVTFSQVQKYRRTVSDAGLVVVGFHSLFYDQPHLEIFKNQDTRNAAMGFLEHLSELCADLGGRFLVFGSPQARKRRGLPVNESDKIMVNFLKKLCQRISKHQVYILLEALGKSESDYIHSLIHVHRIVEQVNAPEMGYHFDAKSATQAGDISMDTMRLIEGKLKHVHINEMDLGVLGKGVDHALVASLLQDVHYSGYVSLEQRMIDASNPWDNLMASIRILKEHYG